MDGIADRRVAEVFAASHAIRPVGKPFDDLLSDMSEPVLEGHVQAIEVKWRDLSRKMNREGQAELDRHGGGQDRADQAAAWSTNRMPGTMLYGYGRSRRSE